MLTPGCGLSLFVIVGCGSPWTQRESTTPSFCTVSNKKQKYEKNINVFHKKTIRGL